MSAEAVHTQTPYRNQKEAAQILRISERTLEKWRVSGEGPPFRKLGAGHRGRCVYHIDELLAWVEARRHFKTGD